MSDIDFLAAYYQEAKFVQWLQKNNLTAMTVENVARYYSLYQRDIMCEELRCHTCAGLKAEWKTEHEIHTGKFTQKNCPIKKTMLLESAAASVQRQLSIPPAFANIKLEELTRIQPKAMSSIVDFIQSFPRAKKNGLYLYSGERQIGRTSALWCIVRALVERHKIYSNFILTTGTMFAENIVLDTRVEGHPYFQRALTCDLLIIDDFGSEKFTDGYTDRLIAILEERYWYLRPILISSKRPLVDWGWAEGREPMLFSKMENTCEGLRLDNAEIEQIV